LDGFIFVRKAPLKADRVSKEQQVEAMSFRITKDWFNQGFSFENKQKPRKWSN